MKVIALQSGSNGNCIYVESGGVRLLFDAGISGKQGKTRLAARGRDIEDVHALLISHDHRDHSRKILLDLIAVHGPKGKWFAAAKDAGCLDVALECATDVWADPSTLIRAARDFADKDANFAAEVALCAIKNLLAGGGYEPTTLDMMHAHRHLEYASTQCGCLDWAQAEVERLIAKGTSSDRQEMLRALMAERGRHS